MKGGRIRGTLYRHKYKVNISWEPMGCRVWLYFCLWKSPLQVKEKWHQKIISEKGLGCQKTEETKQGKHDLQRKMIVFGKWWCSLFEELWKDRVCISIAGRWVVFYTALSLPGSIGCQKQALQIPVNAHLDSGRLKGCHWCLCKSLLQGHKGRSTLDCLCKRLPSGTESI